MFLGDVTLRGQEGTIAWGYHTAAVFRSWVVRRTPSGGWSLSAQLQRADAFQLRQRDLKFTAPRVGGFFCWPVVAVTLTDGTNLSAQLGPPEN
jgi:hypothetical protein